MKLANATRHENKASACPFNLYRLQLSPVKQQISSTEYHCEWSGIWLSRSASHTARMYRSRRNHKLCRNDDESWNLEVRLLLLNRLAYVVARTLGLPSQSIQWELIYIIEVDGKKKHLLAFEIYTSFKSSRNDLGALLFSSALAWRVFRFVPFGYFLWNTGIKIK